VTPPPREPQEPIVVQTPPGTTDKKPDESIVSSPALQPKPNTPPTTPTEPRAVAQLTWTDVRGLVVRSLDDATTWQSAAESIRLDDPARLATLPESWALGKLGKAIEMVLAADSDIEFMVTSDSAPNLELALNRGRVALRDLPVDTLLRFRVASTQFELTVVDRNSSLGVEWHANSPRLVVRAGQVKVNGKTIKSGRQVVWADTGFGPVQPTKGNVAWMQRPDVTTRLPASLLASLKASDDVFATLTELRSNSKAPSDARLIASRWSLALNPTDAAWESLNSPLESMRVQTIEAIVRMSDHDPRLPQVVRAVAAAINDQQAAADMHRWFQLAARRERLAAADAWSMVDSLNHSELAARQIAATFLERGTGMRMPGYNPTDAPRARMQGIQQWSQVINQQFGPRQTPRRRVP
jgi:hypothetical protein